MQAATDPRNTLEAFAAVVDAGTHAGFGRSSDRYLPVLVEVGTDRLHADPACEQLDPDSMTDVMLTSLTPRMIVDAVRAGRACDCPLRWAVDGAHDLHTAMVSVYPAWNWLRGARDVVTRATYANQPTDGTDGTDRDGGNGRQVQVLPLSSDDTDLGRLPWAALWVPQAARDLLDRAATVTFPPVWAGERDQLCERLRLLTALLDDGQYTRDATNRMLDACQVAQAGWLHDLKDRSDEVASLWAEVVWAQEQPALWVEPAERALGLALDGTTDPARMWCLTVDMSVELDPADMRQQVLWALRTISGHHTSRPADIPWQLPVMLGDTAAYVCYADGWLIQVPVLLAVTILANSSNAWVPLLPLADPDTTSGQQVTVALAAAAAMEPADIHLPDLIEVARTACTAPQVAPAA